MYDLVQFKSYPDVYHTQRPKLYICSLLIVELYMSNNRAKIIDLDVQYRFWELGEFSLDNLF